MYDLPRLDEIHFTKFLWRIGNDFLVEFGIECRYASLTSPTGKAIIRKYAIGWAPGENLLFRPKKDHVAIMYFKDERYFWVHLRTNEFVEIFGQP